MTQSHERHPELLPSPKWVRVFLGGEAVADSKNTLLLRAHGQIPIYYFPAEDVHMDYLQPQERGSRVAEQGEGPWPQPPQQVTVYTVQVNNETAENAAWRVEEAPRDLPQLQGYMAFAWQAMDAWYEEDEQIRVHPHDPYHLLDVRHSSRHVRVQVRGVTVADTRRPVVLFETGLPARYYIPKMDVRMEMLALSDRTTHCGYKGTASHYSLQLDSELIENIAWYYPFPNPQYAAIQNRIAFYPQRVDDFIVDGEPQ